MDSPSQPWASTRTPSDRPASQKSARSQRSKRSTSPSPSLEETPLLARESRVDEEEPRRATETSPLLGPSRSQPPSGKRPVVWKRWPSIIALVVLSIAMVVIMLGFFASEGVQEYAMQAAEFEPTRLSLDSLTKTGLKVHVQGTFRMDAKNVKKQSVRNIGRFGTWIAREVESEPTDVEISLPNYENVLLGTVKVPGIKINVRNGHTTHISFFTDLEPGSFSGIRNLANDWMDGRLNGLEIQGRAQVPIKSGILHLGKQSIEQSLELKGGDLPSVPGYNIGRLNLHEATNGSGGMGADVSVRVTNDYPVDLSIPPVAVDVLVDNCMPTDPNIRIGAAQTDSTHVLPRSDAQVNVTGTVEKLPDALTAQCPNSVKSPLDTFISNYIHGHTATVYVNCCKFPDPATPQWTRKLLKDITVPISLAGRSFGKLVKKFSLDDVHFHLPDMLAEPDTPEGQPKISAVVKVLVGLPNEMNFPLNVSRVRATADVFYHDEKLGILHLDEWRKANSSRIDAHGDEGASLLVHSKFEEAPVEITNEDVFSKVVQKLLFGGKSISLKVKAAIDVETGTPMGEFVVREIPAEGVVPVKPVGGQSGSGLGSLSPKLGNLSIVDTAPSSITFNAMVNFTNPTNYSATVPYFNINILANGTILGQATAQDVLVVPGNNTNVPIRAFFDPLAFSGEEGRGVGREFISQYLSGFNTSLALCTHNNSIPAQPSLGYALSNVSVTLPTPKLHTPKAPEGGDDDDDDDDPDGEPSSPHFIQGATMHLISSTAAFTLSSPLSSTTLFLTSVNATAFHESKPAGRIVYDLPFVVPPGVSQTPRLPVDWSLSSVGYDAIKQALGGSVTLSAMADVGVRLGRWEERVWYRGGNIGAGVRL